MTHTLPTGVKSVPAHPTKFPEAGAWWTGDFETHAGQNVHDAQGYYELGLDSWTAAQWANNGISAAEAKECLQVGWQPDEAGAAATYMCAGLYTPAEALVDRLVSDTTEMLMQADRIEERDADREADFVRDWEELPDGRLVPREHDDDWYDPDAPDQYPPREDSQAEIDQANEWGEIEAARAQEQGERLSDEAEAIARGVEEREAALDAMEADPEMVGSEAWAERQYEEMAERGPDDEDILDRIDDAIEGAGWTAEDQAAFEAEVDAAGTGEANPLYVPPSERGETAADQLDDLEPWPPNREPTAEELESGVAVMNEDGDVAWSPTANDFDWTDEQEMRAAGHPAAQAADYSEEPYDEAQYQADTLEYGVGDDLVVGGVVYDSDEWMPDGEGGVMSRAEWRAEQGLDGTGEWLDDTPDDGAWLPEEPVSGSPAPTSGAPTGDTGGADPSPDGPADAGSCDTGPVDGD